MVVEKSRRHVVFGYLKASIQSVNGRLRIIYISCPNAGRSITYKNYATTFKTGDRILRHNGSLNSSISQKKK
jgi:hypothetical protein